MGGAEVVKEEAIEAGYSAEEAGVGEEVDLQVGVGEEVGMEVGVEVDREGAGGEVAVQLDRTSQTLTTNGRR